VAIEEWVQHATGARAAEGADGQGVVADGHDGFDDPGLLEEMEQVAEDGLSAEVGEDLVAFLAEVLQARAAALPPR